MTNVGVGKLRRISGIIGIVAMCSVAPVAAAQDQDTRAGSITNSIKLVLPAGLTDPNLDNNRAADTDFARGGITMRSIGEGAQTLTASGASTPESDPSLQATEFTGEQFENAVIDRITTLNDSAAQDYSDGRELVFDDLAQGTYQFNQVAEDSAKLVSVDCQVTNFSAGSAVRTIDGESLTQGVETMRWSVLESAQSEDASALTPDEQGLEISLVHGENVDCSFETREVELKVDIAWHANGCEADAVTINGEGRYTAGSYLDIDECLVFTIQNGGASTTSSELAVSLGLQNNDGEVPSGLSFLGVPSCSASDGSACPGDVSWENGVLSFGAANGAALAGQGALTIAMPIDAAANLAGDLRFTADLFDPFDREADEAGERSENITIIQDTVADIAVAQDDLGDLLAVGGLGQVPDIFRAFEENSLKTHVCNFGPSDVIETTFGGAAILPEIALPDGLLVTGYQCAPTTYAAVLDAGLAVPRANGEPPQLTALPLSEAVCRANNAADHLDLVTSDTVLRQEMYLPAYSCAQLDVGFRLEF